MAEEESQDPRMISNIIDYLSMEHQQQLTSTVNLGNDFKAIERLDQHFRAMLDRVGVPQDHVAIGLLLRSCHRQFYFGIAQLLRCHRSEMMLALRHSIESSFIVYYMAKHPEDIMDWWDRESKTYKRVYFPIKRFVKDHLDEYPLAESLIPLYEEAGKSSAHATYEWFGNRADFSDPNMAMVNYVQTYRSHDEFLMWFYFLLATYSWIVLLLNHTVSTYLNRELLTPVEVQDIEEFGKLCENNKGIANSRMKEQGFVDE